MSKPKAPSSERPVFINCPFDKDYWPLLQAIVFVVQACGFTPRCALEEDDAGEERLTKIIRIIGECQLSIHDLSRKGPDPVSGLSRFNMPFEMGLCFGFRHFGRRQHMLLAMETKPFEYQKFLSDIAGRDIKHHGDDPEQVIRQIRNWLNAQYRELRLPGGDSLVKRYRVFQFYLPDPLQAKRLEASEITFVDCSRLIDEWLKEDAG